MNHEGFQQRLDFVREIILDEFGFEALDINPIAYDASCPFAYNNFLYGVKVQLHKTQIRTLQPGTVHLPRDISHVVVRLANAASGLPQHNRVENEVGMMQLFRQALAKEDLAHLVPDVYGWGSAEHGQGWILQEFKRGIPLDEFYQSLASQHKSPILDQMAQLLRAVQNHHIPASIKLYGGVSFTNGDLVSGPITTLSAGPFTTYAELYKSMLQQQLSLSDKSPVITGWKEDALRERLESLSEGLKGLVTSYEQRPKALVHSDLTMNNILVDESTKKLTALLDFDWSFVGSTGDEFLRSFFDLGGLPGPDSTGEEQAMRQAILHGFDYQRKFDEPFDQLQAWYEALEKAGAILPSMIPGMEEISELHHFINQIAPWLLTHEVPLKRRSKEQLEAARSNAKHTLIAFLNKHGY